MTESANVPLPEFSPGKEKYPALMYAVGILFGVISAAVHIALEDPLLTPLAVLAGTMFMGAWRPSRPWRWIAVVGLPVPVITGFAVAAGYIKGWDRALIAGAVLAILVGCAGSIGGSLLRRAFENVFRAKS